MAAARGLAVALALCAAAALGPEDHVGHHLACGRLRAERRASHPRRLQLLGDRVQAAGRDEPVLRLRGGFLGKLLHRPRHDHSAARRVEGNNSTENRQQYLSTNVESAGATPVPRDATKLVRSLTDEECLQYVERWKSSGQQGGPAALIKGMLKGSCFSPEDASGDEEDRPSASEETDRWFSVVQGVVERGHVRTLRMLISQNVGGLTVDTKGRHGQTALHVAAARGNEDVINVLCELKADVEATDLLGWVALHQAAYYAQTPAVQCLVEKHKACTTVQTNAGLTPLTLAEEQLRRCEETPLVFPPKDGGIDREQRKQALAETCVYLRARGLQGSKGGAAEAARDHGERKGEKGDNKMAALMRRIATLGRAPGRKGGQRGRDDGVAGYEDRPVDQVTQTRHPKP
jgi:hypothetical protein